MKPLFIPLKTKHYRAFEAGTKNTELRRYGPRWNENTCTVDREVVLSHGYGKNERLTGRVSFFFKTHGSLLTIENQCDVKDVFGTTDVVIALIGIEYIKEIKMFDKVQFELTEQHLRLIRKMTVRYNDHCEFGAPEIDPKRPYGNSGVYSDIAKILEIKPALTKDDEDIYSNEQEKEMLRLHKETAKALQVILAAGSFEPGVYEAEKYHNNWRKV